MRKNMILSGALALALFVPGLLEAQAPAPAKQTRKQCLRTNYASYKKVRRGCRVVKKYKERRACYRKAWADYKKGRRACPRR